MYLYLLVDAIKVLLRDVGDFNNLARVDLLGYIDCRSHSLLFGATFTHVLE